MSRREWRRLARRRGMRARVRGRHRHQHFARGHSGVLHRLELAHVLAVREHADVTAGNDRHARLTRGLEASRRLRPHPERARGRPHPGSARRHRRPRTSGTSRRRCPPSHGHLLRAAVVVLDRADAGRETAHALLGGAWAATRRPASFAAPSRRAVRLHDNAGRRSPPGPSAIVGVHLDRRRRRPRSVLARHAEVLAGRFFGALWDLDSGPNPFGP